MPRLLKRPESYIQQLQLLGADPSKDLPDVDTMSLEDLEQVWEWNGTLPAAVERGVHDMFQDQGLAQPAN